MRESSKYPINGICRFENFPEQNENNDFSEVIIGRMCGVDGWYVSLAIKAEDGINHIYPYLDCPSLTGNKQLAIRCFFSFMNQKPSENSQKVSRVLLDSSWAPIGNFIKLEELLDDKNGWLSNGTLCIEYGFCVESMEGIDGIWKFNFHDKLFDCDNKQNMIPLEDSRCGSDRCSPFYIHKQLLEFHSSYFPEENQKVHEFSSLNWHQHVLELLQIIHGVNVRVQNPCYTLNIGGMCKMNALNVRRYCERQLIKREVEDLGYYFFIASLHNLNHFLPYLLKHVKSGKQLSTIIMKDVEIEKMSSEFMKQCTRYFFENSEN
ncbi:hypothetical protein CRE_16074 [Caenorhabditis remanei]|uniref:Uncharacterized protein n=1 Tax=Caenorhabditis remanei TaxID=31234 RepID=E3MBN9_CAERE|nr:hypothetical protein CRE_16074 [Caenorhabditis remanei]